MEQLLIDYILDLAIQIQQIPSPTFDERRRADFVQRHLQAAGAQELSEDYCGNIYTRITGKGIRPPLVVSAHLDTVFPVYTDLTYTRSDGKISGPGIGDNSLGLAALCGLFSYFGKTKSFPDYSALAGDLWLVANVAEEGLGDLKGMKAVVDRFGKDALGYLVLEGMSLGHIYTRGLGVRRYRIEVHTKGGHAWENYGSPSAIHEIADLIVKIKNLTVPVDPRSSLNVGMITGGTSVNTIAEDASLELDLRSENPQILNQLAMQVESLVKEANQKGGEAISISARVIGDRKPGEIHAEHPLVKAAIECFAKKGIQLKLKTGSTDANVPLSRGYPAICFGITTGGGTHTMREYIEIPPVAQGFTILVDLIQSIFQTVVSNP